MILRKLLLLVLFSAFLTSVFSQTKVTFRVNMKYESVSPYGVHVPGSFQSAAGMMGDWEPSDSLVEAKDPDNDKIYELTVLIPPGNYEYLYVNSNSWIEGSETVPEGCKKTGTDFRELIVGTSDIVLNIVCFSACANCPPFMERNVTFLVVDSNLKIKNLNLKGNMSDWNDFAAYDDGTHGDKKASDYIFTATYKLKKGNFTWNGTADGFELVKNKNLYFTVDSAGHIKGDTVYRVPKLGALIDVTFNIDMSKENISASGVYISGDFMEFLQNPIKNWTRDTLKLSPRLNDSLIYTVKVKMYASKFAWKTWNGLNKINADTFAEKYNFTNAGCGEPDGKGGHNRISNLKGTKTPAILKTFLFNSCNVSADIGNLEKNKISIFPNPAFDKVYIEIDNDNKNDFLIYIYDVFGKQIFCDNASQTTFINTSDYKSGVYFLRVLNSKTNYCFAYKLRIEN